MRAAAADPQLTRDAVAALERCRPDQLDVRETHISWLFLSRERAYKLKKPLVLEFLDYGTPERRRLMCEEEIRLNTRLAPDLYLRVRAVFERADRLQLAAADQPGAIDYVVEMRRYDERQTLSATLSTADSAAIGRLLARFHAACPVARDEHGAARVRAEVERNLEELRRQLASAGEAGAEPGAAAFVSAFISSHRDTIDERARRGRVREGHGDLRAEHVVLKPRLAIVDCVEFDAGLRTMDVAGDLAFLVMDLAALGAEAVSDRIVDAYRASGGDCGDDALVAFYAVHHALIRAKVQLIRASQQQPGSEDRQRAAAAATGYRAVADRFAWRARGPLVLAVCGVPASGKSYLAAGLGGAAQLPVLSSDVVRKQLAGLDPQQRGPREIYSQQFSDRTYRELGRRAARALRSRPLVLVDATFRRARERGAFREAFGSPVAVVFVECVASPGTLERRARERERDRARVSDATLEVVERERRRWEPLTEVANADRLRVRTDRPVEALVAQVAAALDRRSLTRQRADAERP